MDLPVGEHGGRDDLAGDWLFPVFVARPQIEAGDVVLSVAPGIGVGHVDASGLQTAGMLIRGSPSHFFQTGGLRRSGPPARSSRC